MNGNFKLFDEDEKPILVHQPCEHCDSSDASVTWADGRKYCFSCGEFTPPPEDAEPLVPADTIIKPEFNPIDGAISHLPKRGISAETCRKFNYQYARLGETPVQVANYYRRGEIVAQHLRYPDKDFTWSGSPKAAELFGQHLWGERGKRLVITEGEIDAMTISQCFGNKWPVVSVPSGAKSAKKYLKKHYEWVEGYKEIVLAFDDDEAGREAIEECAPLFTPGKVKIMRYDGYKDANELFLIAPKRVAECVLFESKVYRPDGIIAGEDMLDELLTPPERGLESGYPELDEKLYGFLKGELYMFTAGSGIGKSTIVHEIGYRFAQERNQRIGIMALEESTHRAAERHISINLNKPLHLDRSGVTDEDITRAFKETVGSGRYWFFRHFGSTGIDNLLAKVRYMAVALDVDWLILDHISIVVSGLSEGNESERKTIDRLMTALRSLIEETGIGVLAVVHLKRKPGEGKSFNEGGKVRLTDLRGSASLEQLSDSVIAMERDQQNEQTKNITDIRVLKNRRTGDTGVAGSATYNPETGRLLPGALRSDNPFKDEGEYETESDF